MIVFDAAGTLVDVRGSVGEAYAAAVRAAGGEGQPRVIEAAFRTALETAPPLAFPGADPVRLEALERAWWRAVARRAIDSVAGGEGFDFDRFFDLAYGWFGRPEAWRLVPGARPALRVLRRRGLPLMVLSNWDGRLPGVLVELGLRGYFTRILVSSRLGSAKPDPAAFTAARAVAAEIAPGVRPVMVGDRIDNDIRPALDAGWGAVRLKRGAGGSTPSGALEVAHLGALPETIRPRA